MAYHYQTIGLRSNDLKFRYCVQCQTASQFACGVGQWARHNGAGWCTVVHGGAGWCRVVQGGAEWYRVVQVGTEWYEVVV